MKISRINFWVHSVAGLVAAVYAVVIGLTGAVLAFHEDILQHESQAICTASGPASVTADQALEAMRTAHPNGNFLSLTHPNERCGNWSAYLLGSPSHLVNVDAATGEIAGQRTTDAGWLGWLDSLHFNLLGGSTGRLVNGIGTGALVLLALTGLFVWWPGMAKLGASFRLDGRASWGRWLWQVHGMAGAVLCVFLIGFSVTGAYFVWYQPFLDLVGLVFPHEEKLDYVPLAPEQMTGDPLPYAQLVTIAQAQAAGALPHRINLPSSPDLPVRIVLREDHVDAFHNVSSVLLNPYTGEVLQTNLLKDRYSGDSIIAWFSAFHFGVFGKSVLGGLPIKLLWAVMGLGLAFLGATGPYLWWRRRPGGDEARHQEKAMGKRTLRRETIVTGLLLLLVSCGGTETVAVPGPSDAAEAAAAELRIVGLSSPMVETVYTLGLGEMVVGVSESCVFPEQVVADRESGSVAVVGSFTAPSVEEIAALDPDLILTSNEFQRPLAEQLRAAGFEVLHVEPESLEDVFDNIEAIGAAIGKPEAAKALADGYRAELAEIEAISQTLEPVRVYMEMNHMGPWTNGNRSPLEDIIEAAGGENIFDDVDAGAFETTHAEIIARDPEVILSPIWLNAKVGGIDGITPLAEIYTREGYETIDAVEDSRVLYYDSALMKHEGPRQVLAVRKLAHILHPESFADPEETIDWELGRVRE